MFYLVCRFIIQPVHYPFRQEIQLKADRLPAKGYLQKFKGQVRTDGYQNWVLSVKVTPMKIEKVV